jgi:hypothetical protein
MVADGRGVKIQGERVLLYNRAVPLFVPSLCQIL